MGSSRALNILANWTLILRVLDVPVAEHALPARVRCPLCRKGRLSIYEDTISDGAWHYCFDCHAAGDMIELAAAVWGLSPQAAVTKLTLLGVLPKADAEPVNVAKYLRRFPQARRRMQDMWRQAVEFLPQARSPELNALRWQFRLHHNLPKERWEAGPAKMFGALPRRIVEQTFLPKGPDQQGGSPHIHNGGHNNNRVFRGRGWNDVLVVPYYDMPERLCGFYLVGRRGKPEDRTYRGIPRLSGRHPLPQEAGLTGFATVAAARAMFGRFYVALDDPLLALRLQMRHFASSLRPLPLVAFHEDVRHRTEHAWRYLEDRKPVFWTSADLTAAVLHQAILSDGYLCPSKVMAEGRERLDHYVRDNEPRELFQRIVKRGRPWRDALIDWAEEHDNGPIEELLLGLRHYGHDLRPIAALSERLAGIADLPEADREVYIGQTRLVERDDQLWATDYTGRSYLVLNARIRTDGVVVENNVAYTTGRLLSGDDVVPFKVINNWFRLERLCLAFAEVCGRQLYVAPRWGLRNLLAVGTLFAKPEYSPA